MLNIFRPKGKEGEQAAAKKDVLDVFEVAMAQRSKFHLAFDQEITSIHNLSCTLLGFNEEKIKLELTQVKEAGKRWLGQEFTCYFKVNERGRKSREVFHSFRSVVLLAGHGRGGAVLLTVTTPDFLDQDQRRKSLRIPPDIKNFHSFSLWPYNASSGFDLDNPALALDDFKKAMAVLANLSAGGMKLAVKSAKVVTFDQGVQTGSRFVIHVKVDKVPSASMSECWLIAKTNNTVEDFASKTTSMGMEFIGVGQADPETGKVSWRKVVDNVIEDIATWTHQWHLDIYREKGI